jgi:hypothetical protein
MLTLKSLLVNDVDPVSKMLTFVLTLKLLATNTVDPVDPCRRYYHFPVPIAFPIHTVIISIALKQKTIPLFWPKK